MSLDIVAPQSQRVVEGVQGLLRMLQFAQCTTTIVQGAGKLRVNRQRRIEAFQGLFDPPQRQKSASPIVIGGRVARIELNRSVVAVDGGLVILETQQGVAAIEQG